MLKLEVTVPSQLPQIRDKVDSKTHPLHPHFTQGTIKDDHHYRNSIPHRYRAKGNFTGTCAESHLLML